MRKFQLEMPGLEIRLMESRIQYVFKTKIIYLLFPFHFRMKLITERNQSSIADRKKPYSPSQTVAKPRKFNIIHFIF